MVKLKEYSNIFKDVKRIRNKKTGDLGTITMSSPFSINVMWDDYIESVKNSRSKKISMRYDIDKARKLFEPVLDEYSNNVYPGLGGSVMGSVGDASFFGPDSVSKGNSRKPIYKTPKSSIHYKKGKFAIDPDFDNKDNYDQEESSKSYGDDRYFPKNSIHNPKNKIKGEQLGIPTTSSGMIDGGPNKNNKMKKIRIPLPKQVGKIQNTDKKVYDRNKEKRKNFNEGGEENKKLKVENLSKDIIDSDIKNGVYTKIELKDAYLWWGSLSINDELRLVKKYYPFYSSSTYKYKTPARVVVDIWKKEHQNEEITGNHRYLTCDYLDKHKDEIKKGFEKNERIRKELKDYDDNVVPKSSIHFGERDKVSGEKRMKFQNIKKENSIDFKSNMLSKKISNIKNTPTQGDWKSNLNKAVMNLTPEAEPDEQTIPVQQRTFGETPEFPFRYEDGTAMIPVPGGGVAIKEKDIWTFGDTPKMSGMPEDNLNTAVPSANSEPTLNGGVKSNVIDLPCTKKPLIKKFLMMIKNEQNNLHEGVPLNGIFNGKTVKLNTIFEGDERKFKSFSKAKDGTVYQVNFGPKKNENCNVNKIGESESNET